MTEDFVGRGAGPAQLRMYVDELCGRDPRAQRVRAMLLRLERQQGGDERWDEDGAPPTVFTTAYEVGGVKVASQRRAMFTASLQATAEKLDGNVGPAMLHVAEACEVARGLVRRVAERLGQTPPDEVIDFAPGWALWGVGMMCEAWAVFSTPDAPLQREGLAPAEHPDRKEIRFISLVCRDGHVWYCSRIRGEEPEVYAQRVEPVDELDTGGPVVWACGRMLRAMTSDEERGL